MTQSEAAAALVAILDAIEGTVRDMGTSGAPSGVLYAALMGKLSLDQYNAIIGVLVDAGRIRRSGDVLYAI